MPAIESNMMELGTPTPDFELLDVISNTTKSLSDLKGSNGLVVMFICAHCPYVKNLEKKLSSVAKRYTDEGIGFVAISSNDVESYPDDAPEKLKQQAIKNEFIFPYLYDQDQQVAKDYNAACTPDFYFFDQKLKCIYRGRFDASTPGNNYPVSGKDLTEALDSYLSGSPISPDQKPGIGCSIKWKS